MLKELKIDNFKSFSEFKVSLNNVNIVIGKNNAGKSNLCDALRLLRILTSEKDINTGVRKSLGSVSSVFNKYKKKEIYIDVKVNLDNIRDGELDRYVYRLVIKSDKDDELFINEEVLKVENDYDNRCKGELLLFSRHQMEASFATLDRSQENKPEIIQKSVEVQQDESAFKDRFAKNTYEDCFQSYISSIQYYDFDVSELKSNRVIPFEALGEKGDNLFQCIYDMKLSDERSYRELLDLVKRIEPKLEYFNFKKPDEETISVFYEDKEGNRFDRHCLSSGTLRYLAMAYVLVNNEKRFRETGIPTLSIIEEPENGLYVGHFKWLYESFKNSNNQYIFTTHNPYLIDMFDDNLDSIIYLENDGKKTVIKELDKERIEKTLREDMPLGEMHYREILT